MEKKQSHSSMEYSIIGAGASGLFLAYLLLKKGKTVHLYEKTGGVLKKFLIAGKGGLNLTHSESIEKFEEKYNKNQKYFSSLIKGFTPEKLRKELEQWGVETFVGTSGRVFPKNLQARDIQKIWLRKCQEYAQFNLHLKHSLVNYEKSHFLLENENGEEIKIKNRNIILAMGGGSYRATGSDGSWMELMEKMGVETIALRAINCGYLFKWSEKFLEKANYKPLKNISVKVGEKTLRGEVLITDYGIEGSAIYALSGFINQEIETRGEALIQLDLKPDFDQKHIKEILSSSRGKESYSNFLRKKLKLDPFVQSLIKEATTKEQYNDPEILSNVLKGLKLITNQSRPLEEAISTSGGISFNEIDENMMLKKYPGVYVLGEMLDWDAPTGGYLLQGCFSMAYHLSKILP